MTDRLTPPQICDLADLMERYERYAGSRGRPLTWSSWLREEVARREAEAKPQSAATGHYENDCEELGRTGVGQDSARPLPQGEREGPGSAATTPFPKYVGPDENFAKFWNRPEDKPAPADDLVKRLRNPMSWRGADDIELAALAADRIEAQAREIAELKRLANSRLEFANQYAAQLGEAEARVRELEAETKLNGELVDSAQEHARNARVKYLAEKARADGLAANKAVLIEALKLCRELADHIAKAPLPLFRAQATKVRECIDAALTEGGA